MVSKTSAPITLVVNGQNVTFTDSVMLLAACGVGPTTLQAPINWGSISQNSRISGGAMEHWLRIVGQNSTYFELLTG